MRVRTAALVALFAALILSGVSVGQVTSGVSGKVLRGPVSPVCVVARPCQVPASVTLAFGRNGREVARVRSSRAGEYKVALAPGIYSVTPALRHPLWRISPQTVRVRSGSYVHVNFLIDTGIR